MLKPHPMPTDLGSSYNDSEQYGGVTSSPLSHGFDLMNATNEVAPTATTNCNCHAGWDQQCNYGHYGSAQNGGAVCDGFPSPDPDSPPGPGCCTNYWVRDDNAEHGVTNMTTPSADNGANDYIASAFIAFVESRAAEDKPFMAQVSAHNCHGPYIATPDAVARCRANISCVPPGGT